MPRKAATRMSLWIVLLAGSLLVASGCGSDDGQVAAGSGGGGGNETEDAPTGCGAGGEIVLDVSGDFGTFGPQFDPGCLVAPADEPFKITFENVDDGVVHNIAVLVESGGEELGATRPTRLSFREI
jgi:hypothetical protein